MKDREMQQFKMKDQMSLLENEAPANEEPWLIGSHARNVIHMLLVCHVS